MKPAIFPFGYEQNQQWGLHEGSHLFADAQIPHSQQTLVIGISDRTRI
jgi:hypothetical protein